MSGDGFRIVLTWGSTPSDLDSHLYKKDSEGNVLFHTWYSSKNVYYSSTEYEANLDVDDTTGYGPETSTVYVPDDDAIYEFHVHDYSNGGSSTSKEMSNSGAQVRLYSGDRLVSVFNVPTNTVGTLWHVFNYNAATGQVIHVNEFS